MAKTILKELIIILLLCLAIILLLGILLYDYVPASKTLPNLVAYVTPDNVKEELANSSEVDESKIIMTYEVDSTDLNNYRRIQNYKPGKANPFSSYETQQENTTQGSSSNGTNSTSQNANNNETSTSGSQTDNNTTTSGGKFFKDKGTK